MIMRILQMIEPRFADVITTFKIGGRSNDRNKYTFIRLRFNLKVFYLFIYLFIYFFIFIFNL